MISKLAKENDFKFWFSNETNLSLQIVAPLHFNIAIILSSLTNLNLIFMNFLNF